MAKEKWTEGTIGALLARKVFDNDLCVLPNALWTGNEVDLLVCTKDLYLIDVEIKISRVDLKMDKDKDKWWKKHWGKINPVTRLYERPDPTPREYPTKVWKHYYAMPKSIWTESLMEHIQPISGILLVEGRQVECIKRAKPNRKAEPITAEHAIELARLASFRMWKAYESLAKLSCGDRTILPAQASNTHGNNILAESEDTSTNPRSCEQIETPHSA